jgi:hypothetical protein
MAVVHLRPPSGQLSVRPQWTDKRRGDMSSYRPLRPSCQTFASPPSIHLPKPMDPNTADPDNDPQHWISMFRGFAEEWRDSIYSDPPFERVRKQMRLEVLEKVWHVDASVAHRTWFLAFGDRCVPHYKITAGAIIGFYDLFMTLCARSDFFPDVAGAPAESSKQPHPSRYKNYAFLLESARLPLAHRVPEDPVRHALGLYLMTAAFHWLLYHEESHFMAGHLIFMRQMHAQPDISEAANAATDPRQTADLRALESHADERAHLQTVRIYASEPGRWWHPAETLRSQAEGVRVALVALGSVLLLFNANRPSGNSSHPLPLTRLLDAYGVVFTTLAQKEPSLYGPDTSWIDETSMQALMDQTLGDLQVAAQLLRFKGSVAALLRPLFESQAASNKHVIELRSVKERLAQLRPDLAEAQARVVKRSLRGAALDNW